jgi:hypothetical protein
MKINEGFTLHSVGDEYIVIHSGTKNVDFGKIISLNQTAAFLWKEIEGEHFDEDTLKELLLEHYEVDAETAAADVKKLVADWLAAGIVS